MLSKVTRRHSGDLAGCVTVVIPTRNRWPLLRRAIQSVLAQEGVDVEIVIVDDGSDEPAPASLRALLRGHGEIVHLEPPSGVSRARNAGLARATSRWTAFLDDDDFWAPTKLRKQLHAAVRRDAAFAYSGVITLVGRRPLDVYLPPQGELIPELLRRNVIPVSSLVARTETLQALRGFDERLAYLADWDVCIRLAEKGRAAAVFEPLVAYSLHPDNMASRESVEALQNELEYMADKHRAFLGAAGVILPKDAVVREFMGSKRVSALLRARQMLNAGHRRAAAREYVRSARHFGTRRDVIRAAAALAAGRRGEAAVARLRELRAGNDARLLWLEPFRHG
jgi:glycosyltransferase involved in cell wall biosynthesis